MIAPGFTQAVCAVVSPQSNLTANGINNLPGLTAFDRFVEIVGSGLEKEEIIVVIYYRWVSQQIDLPPILVPTTMLD